MVASNPHTVHCIKHGDRIYYGCVVKTMCPLCEIEMFKEKLEEEEESSEPSKRDQFSR